MKRLVIALLLAVTSQYALSQQKSKWPSPVRPRFNADLEFSIPDGEYGKNFGFGFGGAGGLDIPVTRFFYATGTAGLMSFYQGGKSQNTDTRSYIPMKAGGKLYINRSVYGQMEIGTALGVQKNAGSSFILAPGIGASWHFTDKASVNTGVRYESWTRDGGNINFWAVKVGYQF
ncbi:outer membrane beta-barrel protein [Pararcticibacter amylolyticus]|uniref:Outer membrane protein beta-barrel domain-containing protein n=1 Tax=Pararcticibacter amylolyticus TaxID=2173175 RepID=A0A2U2PE52_9SPHI|nr:outer membrane beta-barrel protein [Pararcticibacter amylolyticus]PWG79653.1 hypothetical protein DDR33_16475 [Pararcticibacter amylolyticus]